MDERAELEKQLSEARRKLQELDIRESDKDYKNAIKDLSEFTEKEKISHFDTIYGNAIDMVYAAKNGETSDEDEHYAWESIMEIVARDREKFWKYYNKLNK